MKKLNFNIYSTLIFAGLAISGCSSSEEKMNSAEQKVKDAKENVVEEKQDLVKAQETVNEEFQKFKSESKDEIRRNENHIAELRIDSKNEKATTKIIEEKKIDALEKRNRELNEKLEVYNDDGKSDWKVFKNEFKHDLDGLGHAFKDIGVRNTR